MRKIVISLDPEMLARLDRWIAVAGLRDRQHAIETAVSESLERFVRSRLGRERLKLDPRAGKTSAEGAISKRKGIRRQTRRPTMGWLAHPEAPASLEEFRRLRRSLSREVARRVRAWPTK